MLKREITYETFEDPPKKITETFYFHLTMPEFAMMNPDVDPNADPDDIKFVEIVAKTEDIILNSFGVRSEDGLNFDKSEEARNKFKSSAAYMALADELFTDENALTVFIRGVLPGKLADGLDKITAMQEKGASNKEILAAVTGPTPPVSPTPPTS